MSVARNPAREWQRLSAGSSLTDLLGRYVDDLIGLTAQQALGCDEAALAVPPGWYVVPAIAGAQQPVRVAVTGHRLRGGWQSCDTVAAAAFTGMPPEILTDHAARVLRDADTAGVTVRSLSTPPVPGVCAVRSSGYLTVSAVRMWAQISSYVAGSNDPGTGRLIQHSQFVTTQRRTQLRSDIAQLSDSVHAAFLAACRQTPRPVF